MVFNFSIPKGLHDPVEGRKVAVQHAHQFLRREPLGKRTEAHEIGEQHGDIGKISRLEEKIVEATELLEVLEK